MYGKYLRDIEVILWDEISMTYKLAFQCVDRFFKDLCESDEPFGGKIIITTGDFR